MKQARDAARLIEGLLFGLIEQGRGGRNPA